MRKNIIVGKKKEVKKAVKWEYWGNSKEIGVTNRPSNDLGTGEWESFGGRSGCVLGGLVEAE